MLDLVFHRLVPLLLELAGGSVGLYWVTELVKNSKFVSFINPGQKGRILTLVGTLSAVLAYVVAYANNSLTPEMAQQGLVGLVSFASMWYGAHTVHKTIVPR